MLRFFRNIRQKLISENSQKYFLYAIGEIALVMIGILLALQVNNWNEDRKERVTEREFKLQLLDDAKEDALFFESRSNLLNRYANEWRLIQVEVNSPWMDSMYAAINDSAYSFYFRVVHDSFLITNNPDPFLKIESPKLKEILRNYQNAHNYVSIATELLNRIVEEHGVPLELKYSKNLQLITNGHHEEVNTQFLRNEDIQAAVTLFTSLSENALGTLPPFLEVNNQLIEQLNSELKGDQN